MGKLVVRKGLAEGQQVVSSGHSSSTEANTRCCRPHTVHRLHEGTGTIDEIGKDEITLTRADSRAQMGCDDGR
jgi:hypothetical protein